MEENEARDRFLLLVEEYRLAAWIGLGKLKDPASGEVHRNLDLARHAIDTLGMLELKTRGNLVAEEERLLRQALTDLRINFVDEVKGGGREQEKENADRAAGSPAAGGEPGAAAPEAETAGGQPEGAPPSGAA